MRIAIARGYYPPHIMKWRVVQIKGKEIALAGIHVQKDIIAGVDGTFISHIS